MGSYPAWQPVAKGNGSLCHVILSPCRKSRINDFALIEQL